MQAKIEALNFGSDPLRFTAKSPLISTENNTLDFQVVISEAPLSSEEVSYLKMVCVGQYLQYKIRKRGIVSVYSSLTDDTREKYTLESFKKIVRRLWTKKKDPAIKGPKKTTIKLENKDVFVEGSIKDYYLLNEILNILGIRFEDIMVRREYRNTTKTLIESLYRRLEFMEQSLERIEERKSNHSKLGRSSVNTKFEIFFILIRISFSISTHVDHDTEMDSLYNDFQNYNKDVYILSNLIYELVRAYDQSRYNFLYLNGVLGQLKDFLQNTLLDTYRDKNDPVSITIKESCNNCISAINDTQIFSKKESHDRIELFTIEQRYQYILWILGYIKASIFQFMTATQKSKFIFFQSDMSSVLSSEIVYLIEIAKTKNGNWFEAFFQRYSDKIIKDEYVYSFADAINNKIISKQMKSFLLPVFDTYILLFCCMRFISSFTGKFNSNCFYSENSDNKEYDPDITHNQLHLKRKNYIDEDFIHFRKNCMMVIKYIRGLSDFCRDLGLRKTNSGVDMINSRDLFVESASFLNKIFNLSAYPDQEKLYKGLLATYQNKINPQFKNANNKIEPSQGGLVLHKPKAEIDDFFNLQFGSDVRFKIDKEVLNEFDALVFKFADTIKAAKLKIRQL